MQPLVNPSLLHNVVGLSLADDSDLVEDLSLADDSDPAADWSVADDSDPAADLSVADDSDLVADWLLLIEVVGQLVVHDHVIDR